nr:hypothetical protein [uncultured Rhodoferax sp.]
MTSLKDLPHNGEWWLDPWWEDPEGRFHFPCPKSDVIAGVEALKRYFDSEWARKLMRSNQRNFILPLLFFQKGTQSLSLFANLGAAITATESSSGFAQKMKDLKGEKSSSAYFEFQIAHLLCRAGYGIEFPLEGKEKSYDIHAANGLHSFAIECKRLELQDWEQWESQLTFDVIQAHPSAVDGRELSLTVHLNPRMTDVRLAKDDDLNTHFSDAISAEIRRQVKARIERKEIPIKFVIEGIATVELNWKESGVTSSVTGMERTEPALFRRIFQNGVLRAMEQLPEETPGIAVIFSTQVPPPSFFRLFFDAACENQKKRFGKLIGVVICQQQTLFHKSRPVIYLNRHATHIESRQAVEQIFLEELGAVSE